MKPTINTSLAGFVLHHRRYQTVHLGKIHMPSAFQPFVPSVAQKQKARRFPSGLLRDLKNLAWFVYAQTPAGPFRER